MKLVVGLGNPGPEYSATRHNVGFRVVECLARRHDIALDQRRFRGRFARGRARGAEVALLEPQTYMNRSGASVLAALDGLGIEDPAASLLVVYDDLDLPFGRLRIRPGGGAGGHRGLADLQEQLGRDDFPRLRFGIGRPPPGEDAVAYVLAPFAPDEEEVLEDRLACAADAVEAILVDGVTQAMDRFNPAPAE